MTFRVAIAVSDRIVPQWQAALVHDAFHVNGVEISILKVNPDPNRSSAPPTYAKVSAFDYFLTRRLASVKDPSVDAFIGQPVQTSNFSKGFFDIVLDLAGNASTCRALTPRRGIWSLDFGKARRSHDAAPCVEEVIARDDVTHCRLIEYRADGAATLLIEAKPAVDANSIYVTRAQALWAAPVLVIAALRRIINGIPAPAAPAPVTSHAQTPDHETSPDLIVRLIGRGFKLALRNIFGRDQWRIHFRIGEAADYRQSGAPADFNLLPTPKGGFLADPFGIEWQGRTAVFYEEFSGQKQRGIISCTEIKSDGHIVSTDILKKPYHLSYPFLTVSDGKLHMIPESAAHNTVDLYRCTHFPDQWEHVSTLMHGLKAVDSTLARIGDKLWMFAAVKRSETRNFDELHLFSADSLTGPWLPHPLNPVRFDARDCRPAGALFQDGTSWIRPTQDGTVRYGRRIRFQRILKLTATEYEEETVSVMEAAAIPDGEGIHTWNRHGRLSTFDSVRRIFKPGF